MINGEWILNPANVKEAFLQYYKDKFQAYVPQVNYTSHSSFASLSMAERIDLEKSVSSVEIRKAEIGICGKRTKSPGSDGFTFLFLKRYWDIFKSDVEFFVSEFFSSSKMPPGTNSSFITLIPRSGSLPFTYLGLPIGSNMSRLTHWQGFIDKFNSRLSKWKVRFWKDNWSGDTPLAQRYNRLFRLDLEPNCMVSDRYVNGEWNLKWIRPIIYGRNLDYLACLTSELEQVISFEGQDELRWSFGCDGTFTVKDTRHHIDDIILPTLETSTICSRTLFCRQIGELG
ncbi:hypothetical protein Tco_1089475 [Tanacetum coccineum]